MPHRARLADEVVGDLRYAVRALRRAPAFATVAVLVLALGIGAATAVYSVLDGVLLRPLPVRDPERLVVAWGEHKARSFPHLPMPIGDARLFAADARTVATVAAVDYSGAWERLFRDGDRDVPVRSALVSGDFFRVLGASAGLGRLLAPEDDVPGAPLAAVLTHEAWQGRFDGDPRVLGRTLRLHATGALVTIVGVAPRGLVYPKGTELWLPIAPVSRQFGTDSAQLMVDVLARLADGATVEGARAEFGAFLAREGVPEFFRGTTPVVATLPERVTGQARPALLVLGAAAALLLLIACVNVAGLLLVRGVGRAREMAVRAALGAGRARLARQLCIEGAVLAAIGGVAGAWLAVVAVRALVAAAPAELPRADAVAVDGRVLAAALGMTLLTALLAGLVPALVATREGSSGWAVLRSGARGGESRGAGRARRLLVVGQVALALVLLAGAGLVARSLARLQALDPGFAAERLLVLDLELPLEPYRDPRRVLAFHEELAPRLAALPGVRASAPLVSTPFAGTGGWDGLFVTEGQETASAASNPMLSMELATPSFFATLGIPIERGRAFAESDRQGAVKVVVLSQAAARALWPGEDPLGKRLSFPGPKPDWWTVVGIAAETRYRELREPRPTIYIPVRQAPFPYGPTLLAVRATGDPASVLPSVRRALREVDPGVVVMESATMERLLAEPLAQPRYGTILLGTFAAIALLLSAVGLYGVVAVMVRQRTRELGIRVALGATQQDVRRAVLGQGLVIGLAGVAAGLVIALAATRLLSAVLFEVSPTDPLTLGGVSLAMLFVALLASWAPARQATRVDPIEALRAD